MEQVLPNGKVKVTGAVANEEWRKKHEEAKKKREERWKNNPQLREKYEERKKEREEAQQQRDAQEKAALEQRIRKKMIAEMNEQFGIEDDYIEQKKAAIAKIKEENPYLNGQRSIIDEARDKENALLGDYRAAGADKRGIKQEKWGILRTILEIVGAIPNPIGTILKIISIPFAMVNIKRKEKSYDSNMAKTAEALPEWEAAVLKIEKELNAVATRMQADEPMMVEKYKTMKKEDFNLYLKGYVAGILKEMGLATEKSNEILKEMNQQIKNKAGDQQEEKEEGEEKQEAEEPAKEEPEKETEEPEKDPEEKGEETPESGEEEKENEQPTEDVEEKEESEQGAEEPVKEEPEQEVEEPVKEEPEQVVEEPAKEEPEQVVEEPAKEEPEIQVEAVPVENVPEGAEVQTAEVVEEKPQAEEKTDEAVVNAVKENVQPENAEAEVTGPAVIEKVTIKDIETAKAEIEKESEDSIEITVKVPKAAGNQKIVINKGDKGVEIEQMGE